MQMIDAPTTRAALGFDRLVPALRAMFVSGAEVPARHVHIIGAMTSLVMPAWQAGRYYGLKVVNVAPDNAAHGLSALHAAYVLFDAASGVPLALIDGDEITSRRTAAAYALAASMLARRNARHLLVVGAGRVARLLPEAYRAVLGIEEVTVWARDADKAKALASELRARGIPARSSASLEADARNADIVSCATLAAEPVVRGAWLAPGSHLDLIGSFRPEMREGDDDCFHGASVFVDTEEALQKSGDLLVPLVHGVLTHAQVRGTLARLCRGDASGRRDDAERTVFKSVGSALEDLAAAILVHESTVGTPAA